MLYSTFPSSYTLVVSMYDPDRPFYSPCLAPGHFKPFESPYGVGIAALALGVVTPNGPSGVSDAFRAAIQGLPLSTRAQMSKALDLFKRGLTSLALPEREFETETGKAFLLLVDEMEQRLAFPLRHTTVDSPYGLVRLWQVSRNT